MRDGTLSQITDARKFHLHKVILLEIKHTAACTEGVPGESRDCLDFVLLAKTPDSNWCNK